jgi:hypothetical protein
MALILVAAVGFAALRHASDTWAYVMLGLATLAFVAAAVRAVLCRARQRAFWAGFAAFGAIFLIVSCAPWLADHVGPSLPTTQLLDALYPHLGLNPSQGLMVVTYSTATGGPNGRVYLSTTRNAVASPAPVRFRVVTTPTGNAPSRYRVVTILAYAPVPFRRVGNSLISLLLGWIGGLIVVGIFLIDQRRRSTASEATG